MCHLFARSFEEIRLFRGELALGELVAFRPDVLHSFKKVGP
jgi:hypothetical protein